MASFLFSGQTRGLLFRSLTGRFFCRLANCLFSFERAYLLTVDLVLEECKAILDLKACLLDIGEVYIVQYEFEIADLEGDIRRSEVFGAVKRSDLAGLDGLPIFNKVSAFAERQKCDGLIGFIGSSSSISIPSDSESTETCSIASGSVSASGRSSAKAMQVKDSERTTATDTAIAESLL